MKTRSLFFLAFFTPTLFIQDYIEQKKSKENYGTSFNIPLCVNVNMGKLVAIIDSIDGPAPILPGLGNYQFKVTTNSKDAQRYIDQGLALYYGFNHAEAYRSFREAAKIDSDCAMAYWGQALCLGPNINSPMDPADSKVVYENVQKAVDLKDKATVREQSYIMALSKRYIQNPPEDRTQLDQAYSDAMKEVAKIYPNDLDAATLYAESLMDLHPWDYWTKEGQPKPWAPEIVAQIENVLSKDINHVGANHLYIHAVEASYDPARAIPAADRLLTMLPGAGHLVHMPSHVYIRTGRYHDGSNANEAAIKADEKYFELCKTQGAYPLAYYPHNIHFLVASSTFEGRSQTALKASRLLAEKVDKTMLNDPIFTQALQSFYHMPILTMTRFGLWDDVLKEPMPEDTLKYSVGTFRYARGIAYVRKNQMEMAIKELNELDDVLVDGKLKEFKIFFKNDAQTVLEIARNVLSGEIEARKGNYSKAISDLKKAVELEDALTYQEPADWHQPVREVLGAVLIEAGKFTDAANAYHEDLKMYPENGWALYGLYLAEQKQGKKTEAAKTLTRYHKAFERADIKLQSSRL
ncbi:tetratricopeptide repeat protein [Solitalea koreensis]|uniref:Tetratricopeptide repeat-containing protein n=1 Tax=Solitalea koreensis TaxID=543615 RepID=A0A521C7I1_9SPHI|nr:tetratricopeptide repeat protein [Solitalea koreensis]SMO54761.1 Tetratricopeptide repeat-containing protein [Solitalea koreensis]